MSNYAKENPDLVNAAKHAITKGDPIKSIAFDFAVSAGTYFVKNVISDIKAQREMEEDLRRLELGAEIDRLTYLKSRLDRVKKRKKASDKKRKQKKNSVREYVEVELDDNDTHPTSKKSLRRLFNEE